MLASWIATPPTQSDFLAKRHWFYRGPTDISAGGSNRYFSKWFKPIFQQVAKTDISAGC